MKKAFIVSNRFDGSAPVGVRRCVGSRRPWWWWRRPWWWRRNARWGGGCEWRRWRGGGGGGYRGGGGGGYRGAGGGGYRGGGTAPRTPSMSRPSTRPSSITRPSGGIRNRSSTRPSYGNLPTPGMRPGTGVGGRPGTGSIASRPGGARPSVGTRPARVSTRCRWSTRHWKHREPAGRHTTSRRRYSSGCGCSARRRHTANRLEDHRIATCRTSSICPHEVDTPAQVGHRLDLSLRGPVWRAVHCRRRCRRILAEPSRQRTTQYRRATRRGRYRIDIAARPGGGIQPGAGQRPG